MLCLVIVSVANIGMVLSQCRQITGTSAQMPRISALFWGSKRSVAQKEVDLSLGDFTLTGSAPKEILANEVKPKKISHSVVASILDVSPSEWDACGLDATGPEKFNTLLTHGFLSSLEESGSAVQSQLSSLHITFPSKNERQKLKGKSFLQRIGMQYHQ